MAEETGTNIPATQLQEALAENPLQADVSLEQRIWLNEIVCSAPSSYVLVDTRFSRMIFGMEIQLSKPRRF
jgi:hypothetical protein